MTLVDLLKAEAARMPDRTAILCGSRRVSYGDLCRQVRAVAAALAGAGLRKGECVALLMNKSPEAIAAFLGVLGAGCVACPINHLAPAEDIRTTLDFVGSRALIAAAIFEHLLASLPIAGRQDRVIGVGFRPAGSGRSWDEIVNESAEFPPVEVNDDDIAYLNFTSGSTGSANAGLTTHGNIYWNTLASVEALGLTRDDIHLCMFPVFTHPHEIFARPLFLGGSMVLVDGIRPRAIARAIMQHRVTCMMAVSAVYASVVRHLRLHAFDTHSLRLAESGGMSVPPSLFRETASLLGVPITRVWGSTETTGVALACMPEDQDGFNLLGRPCPYYEVQVVDEQGRRVGPGVTGEMAIRGPGVCRGYYGNAGKTNSRFRDGWFLTGDLVRCDDDGCFHFVDRLSRMIKVAGQRVYPAEIESVLRSHPFVAEAAVVRQADKTHGDVPKAFIALEQGASVDAAAIRRYCAERLSSCEVPKTVQFCRELPKTASGKVLYQALEER